ncbi:hypothetical protein ACO0LC_28945 [Undibacterium sp. JH2W]|uniref:hypothetical protein n=1 Tax=Undibacterium sp. JH2W TaxID=3413037 RepID=UPI003BF16AA3
MTTITDSPGLAQRIWPEGKTKVSFMCLSIEGFMRNYKFPKGWDCFEKTDGSPMSPGQAFTLLSQHQAKGHKVISISHECDNPCKHTDQGCTGFDYENGCPGPYKNESNRKDAL